jgi:FkbM family methyltransferase
MATCFAVNAHLPPKIQNRAVRGILWPGLALRRRWLSRRHRRRRALFESLVDRMAEDPVLELPEFRGRFAIGARSDLFRRCALDGEYEPAEARTCTELIDPSRDAIDVGANIGFFSVLLAKSLNPGRRLLSIEPTTGAMERLKSNIERNRVADRVVLFHGVVSNTDGEASIHVIDGKEEYASLGAIVHPSAKGLSVSRRPVPCSTLDSLVERFELDPGFVKIDVEGFEGAAFEGAKRTLRDHRPIVLSELDDALLGQNGSSAEAVLALFETAGYVAIDPASGEPLRSASHAGSVVFKPR